MKKCEIYRQERANGLTYQEIADKYGVSKQRIGQVCAEYNPFYFRPWSETSCVYPNVRNWLNKNKITKAELIRRLGLTLHYTHYTRVGYYLRGEHYPSKKMIDALLDMTGLTYEKFFKRD